MLSVYFSAVFLSLLVPSIVHGRKFPQNPQWGPWPIFKTEPLFDSTIINITQTPNDHSLLAPGYIFFSLQSFQIVDGRWGPQIFDDKGMLIFYGPENEELKVGDHDPHVCDYMGEHMNHLCNSFTLERIGDERQPTKIIVDNSYSKIGSTYSIPHGTMRLTAPDAHDFNMLPGGYSFLYPTYMFKEMDLRAYEGLEKGWVFDACFREVSVPENNVIFEWCYLDYLELWETTIYLEGNSKNWTSHIAGNGDTSPWDFLHANAVDKSEDNEYIVSARHLDQILCIAGNNHAGGLEPGTVIWRLGGKSSDFDMGTLTFSKQHHVRYLSVTKNETIISLFDNAWEGDNTPSSDSSSGKIISINNQTMKAHLVQEYRHKEPKLSSAQGSMQVLPNGNAMVGWGWDTPEASEFDNAGNLLWHARLHPYEHMFSYRVWRQPWVAQPSWPPKLVAYMQDCNREKPLVAYASWNGATEVRYWRYFLSFKGPEGPWYPAGTYEKDDFETEVTLRNGNTWFSQPAVQFVRVEALDASHNTLGTATARTFVPPKNETGCDERSCSDPERYTYDPALTIIGTCSAESTSTPGLAALLLFCGLVESLIGIFSFFLRAHQNRSRRRHRTSYLFHGKYTHLPSKGFDAIA